MITSSEKRIAYLLLAGVPQCFLEALQDLKQFGDVQHIIRPPDAAYFYIPQILDNWEWLTGFEVTPICNGSNDDTYYVLLTKGPEMRFVSFGLEQDEISSDFGSDFRVMLADLLIDLYEFSEEDISTQTDIGIRLGFKNSKVLFQSLAEATASGSRRTFESDSAWRAAHVPGIVA